MNQVPASVFVFTPTSTPTPAFMLAYMLVHVREDTLSITTQSKSQSLNRMTAWRV